MRYRIDQIKIRPGEDKDTFARAIKKKLRQEKYISNLMYSLCPQYLFLFSDEPIGVFVHDQYPVGIEYWLGDREHDYELLDADRDMAQALLACNSVFDD